MRFWVSTRSSKHSFTVTATRAINWGSGGFGQLGVAASAEGQGPAQVNGAGLSARVGFLWALAAVGDVRREGLVAGVELVADWKTLRAFALKDRAGIRVRGDGPKRRLDATDWECDSAVAAILYYGRTVAPDGARLARIHCGSARR